MWKGWRGDLLANAIRDNVRLNVTQLRGASPILRAAAQSKSPRVVDGYCDLASGEAELIDA